MIYVSLFFEFFKIGLFCFGGAMGMIPIIAESVEANGWMTQSELFELVGICESTPGPIAVNIATYVGSLQGGVPGSIAATVGVVLPSFIIILLIASVLRMLTQKAYFKGFMKGVGPVVTALVLYAGIEFVANVAGIAYGESVDIDPVGIACLVIVTVVWGIVRKTKGKKLTSMQIIGVSAVSGSLIGIIIEFL